MIATSDRLLPLNTTLLSDRRSTCRPDGTADAPLEHPGVPVRRGYRHLALPMLILMSALGAACQMSAEPEPMPGSDLAAWIEPALALAPERRADPATLVIDRTSHDFGQVRVAQSSAATVFTVENTGPKAISGLALHLEPGTGFTVTATTCAGWLNRRSSCTIAVAFAPVHAGSAQAELLVQAGDLATRATLAGTGAATLRVVNHVAGYDVEVLSEPAGIACGAVCELTFTTHEILLDRGAFDLAAWNGPCEPVGENTCLVRLEADTTVELQFFEPGLLWSESVVYTSVLATDAERNIIAGGRDFPWLTKYSPDGQILWQIMPFAGVWSVAVDASGNIGIIDLYGSALLKLDGAGNVQWSIEPSSSDHWRSEAAFDPSGNLHVAGAVMSPEGDTSVLRLEKYDPSGVLSWSRDYPRGTLAWVADMAVDQGGNVLILVSEMVYDSTGSWDYVDSLRKYDGDGNLLWTSQEPYYTGSLGVDAAGNVFFLNYGEQRIEKRAPDGTRLWSVSVTELGDVWGLAVNPAGDAIAVGGRVFGDGAHHGVWAAKIDGATGERRREIQIRSDVASAGFHGVAVDGHGDVIIPGWFIGEDFDYWWLRKYDAAIFDRVLE